MASRSGRDRVKVDQMQITRLFIRGNQMGLSQRWRCDEAEVRVMPLLKVNHKPKHAGDLWKLETAKNRLSSNLWQDCSLAETYILELWLP